MRQFVGIPAVDEPKANFFRYDTIARVGETRRLRGSGPDTCASGVVMDHTVWITTLAFLAAGVAALGLLLAHQRLASTRLRRYNAWLTRDLALRDEELRHLVAVRLPELVNVPASPPPEARSGPLHERELRGTPFEHDLRCVTDLFARCAEQARNNAERSAKGTLRSMMRGVQSLANEQQLAISAMQMRHDDPDVLADLLKIDHMNAQMGRRAQATAVLCGSWPGQQRSASSLVDVVRGATSRIRDYPRVRVHEHASVAVVSRAVEPVVLTVAELLDNAARHSQPNTPVEVNFQSAHNGVAITVDDAGVAMNAEETRRASHLLAGRQPVNIDRLGDPPRVGFAVAGVLAARYGFTVSVDTRSPYGGVRGVVFLPAELLASRPGLDASDPPRTTAPDTAGLPLPDVAAAPPARTTGGLPQRQRTTPAGPTSVGQPARAADHPGRPARETAAGMGAWQRGTRSGRADDVPDSEGKNTQP